jgi:hypothetical protein
MTSSLQSDAMRPRARTVCRVLVAAAAASAVAPSAAVAAPAGATATSRLGGAEAWLERDGAKDRRSVHYQARPNEPSRVLARGLQLGRDADDLSLGTDGSGRRIVVVTTRRGLSQLTVSGGELSRLRFSRSGDDHPSVLGGRVAFVRSNDVMLAGLSRPRARTVQRAGDALTTFTDTAVGAGGSVAWVRYLESESPRMRAEVRAPGGRITRLMEMRADLSPDAELTFSSITEDGSKVQLRSVRDGGATERGFALPGGTPTDG